MTEVIVGRSTTLLFNPSTDASAASDAHSLARSLCFWEFRFAYKSRDLPCGSPSTGSPVTAWAFLVGNPKGSH